MNKARLIAIPVVAALCAGACGKATPTAPPAIDTAAMVSLDKNVGDSCSVDVGPTDYPLLAVHHMEDFLNTSLQHPESSVNCGGVRSLDAMLEGVATALDQESPDYDRACGVSGALLNKLESLVNTGQLTTPTFPDPGGGAPITVVDAAQFLNGRWCAAAAGEIPNPGR